MCEMTGRLHVRVLQPITLCISERKGGPDSLDPTLYPFYGSVYWPEVDHCRLPRTSREKPSWGGYPSFLLLASSPPNEGRFASKYLPVRPLKVPHVKCCCRLIVFTIAKTVTGAMLARFVKKRGNLNTNTATISSKGTLSDDFVLDVIASWRPVICWCF